MFGTPASPERSTFGKRNERSRSRGRGSMPSAPMDPPPLRHERVSSRDRVSVATPPSDPPPLAVALAA
eukprot:535793-Amphidinium_carterae.1